MSDVSRSDADHIAMFTVSKKGKQGWFPSNSGVSQLAAWMQSHYLAPRKAFWG